MLIIDLQERSNATVVKLTYLNFLFSKQIKIFQLILNFNRSYGTLDLKLKKIQLGILFSKKLFTPI